MSTNPENNTPNNSDEYVPGTYSQNTPNTSASLDGSQNNYGDYSAPSSAPQAPHYEQNSAQGSATNQQYSAPSYNQNQQGGYQNYQMNTAKPEGHGMGLAAMIVGIVGLLTCWLFIGGIAGIVAVVLGIIALRKLKKTPGAKKGMAITGIVTGTLAIVGTLIVTIAAVLLGGITAEAIDHCKEFENDSTAYQKCVEDYVENNF